MRKDRLLISPQLPHINGCSSTNLQAGVRRADSKKAIQESFRNSKSGSDYVWLTIDMTRLINAQEAAKKASKK